ncbi:hypothetical protein OBBRIDRAFT_737845, partial [Obba rivulosa]
AMDVTITALHDAYATRYLGAAGLVVLVYDYIFTITDEVQLVWTAPRTIAKWTFLVNRYLVLATQLAVAYEMCGFVGNVCKRFVFVSSMLAITSVGIANMLVLHRVIILWDHRAVILKVMVAGLLLGFSAQMITMIITLLEVTPSISWSPIAGMCIAETSTHLLVVVWASPMLFELLVLCSTALNALDRPRAAHQRLTQALHRDGISYFVAITLLRIYNLSVSATAIRRPSQTFLSVYLVWAMTTTVLNRSLLNLRRAEIGTHDPLQGGRASPFTIPLVKMGDSNVILRGAGEDDDVWTSQTYLRSYYPRWGSTAGR